MIPLTTLSPFCPPPCSSHTLPPHATPSVNWLWSRLEPTLPVTLCIPVTVCCWDTGMCCSPVPPEGCVGSIGTIFGLFAENGKRRFLVPEFCKIFSYGSLFIKGHVAAWDPAVCFVVSQSKMSALCAGSRGNPRHVGAQPENLPIRAAGKWRPRVMHDCDDTINHSKTPKLHVRIVSSTE